MTPMAIAATASAISTAAMPATSANSVQSIA